MDWMVESKTPIMATSPGSPGPGGCKPEADRSFGTDDPLANLIRTSTT